MKRKSRRIVIAIIFLFIGCKQDNKIKSKDIKTQMDEADKYYEILRKNGFIFPSEMIYNTKLKEVFGLDLNLYPNEKEIEINPRTLVVDSQELYPIAIKDKRFVLWYPDPTEGDNYDDPLAFVYLNKYIFYNDKMAFNYLKLHNDNSYLGSLIVYFGYKGNKDQEKEYLNYIFNDSEKKISDLFNLFFGRNGINGVWELRKELLEEYLDFYPKANIYDSGFIEDLIDKSSPGYIKKYEGNREKDISFLLEKLLYQVRKRGDLRDGAVNNVLEQNPEFLNTLRKNNAFGYPLLNDYIRQGPPMSNCIINDSDGYTNLRKEKNTTSKILQKIKTGNEVSIIDVSGDWFYVHTKENNMGYVHKSKLRLE